MLTAQTPKQEIDMEQTVTLPLNLVLQAVNALSRMGEALRDPENELLRLVTEVEAQLEPQLQED